MPFRRDSRPAPDQIEAIIGPRATFDGRLRCDGSVRVDGTMEGGSIETLGNVLITARRACHGGHQGEDGVRGRRLQGHHHGRSGGTAGRRAAVGHHQRADVPAGRGRATSTANW